MEQDKVLRFRQELLKLENAFDCIFIDTGAGMSTNVMNFVFMADEVIVIMTPEPTAFADAYAMVKVVTQEKPALKISVVINMSNNDDRSRVVFSKFNEIVRKFLGRETIYRGAVVYDSVVTEAIMRQIPLALYAGKSPAMQSIRLIARNLLGLEQSKQKTLFDR